MARLSVRKRLAFSILACVIGLGFLEGLLHLVQVTSDYQQFRNSLPTATDSPESHHAQSDPDLGWVHIPDRVHHDFYGPGLTLSIGHQGLRENPADSAEERGQERGPEQNTLFRIVCLGDSFTLGYGVGDADTFPAKLQSLNPRTETLNMGQGGYSVGQCYLWFRRLGSELQADCVVLAMITDDIWRMNSTRMMNGYSMPRFELQDGRLVVSGQPVPAKIPTGQSLEPNTRIGSFFLEHTAIGQFSRQTLGGHGSLEQSDARQQLLDVTMGIIRALQGVVERSGGRFAVVLLPEFRELIDTQAHHDNRLVATRLEQLATDRNIPFLDLTSDFATLTARQRANHYLDEQWHHYSSTGNQLVAERLHAFLRQYVTDYPKSR